MELEYNNDNNKEKVNLFQQGNEILINKRLSESTCDM